MRNLIVALALGATILVSGCFFGYTEREKQVVPSATESELHNQQMRNYQQQEQINQQQYEINKQRHELDWFLQ